MDKANKIVRTVCIFKDDPNDKTLQEIESIVGLLADNGFTIQTKRLCSHLKIKDLNERISDENIYLSVGTLGLDEAKNQLPDFLRAKNTSFNIELANQTITEDVVNVLFEIIKHKPEKTFNFAYVFNNPSSSPYFPSANYANDGFSLGLQPTDLADKCESLDEWLEKMRVVWIEIKKIFEDNPKFLGIDSSIAPLFTNESSLINFVKKLHGNFNDSVKTDSYLKITEFIKTQNPKPVGLCGLMLPCLEDFELAAEYEKGNFSIERNIFLSLQSGLGIDTYPIGIDENPQKVLGVLSLLQRLSNKYQKPLSARFVSDGKSKIGEKTDFKNQYLEDVVLKSL